MSDNNSVVARLLDAGERLFAEGGYDGTSVRALTKEAGCNLAAVNYHFGGKYELYREVLRRRILALRDVRIERVGGVIKAEGDKLTLEKLVRAFATAFVEPLVNDSEGRRFMRLIAWEMVQLRFPREDFLRDMIQPVVELMREALVRLCPGLSEQKAAECISSMVAQLLHAVHIEHAFSEENMRSLGLGGMKERVDHIVAFSAAGIRGCVQERRD